MNHSKDYLIDFSKGKDLWLVFLINKVIESNGILNSTDNYVLDAYKILINEKTDCNIPTNLTIINNKNNCSFKLESLEHISGVNALKNNQKIVFNKDITILYGPNGSGKSSYFRILNEICGGNEQKKIIPNIYANDVQPVNVIIKNNIDSNYKTWDATIRGIEPYNLMSVYDSSYMKGLIEVRSANEALIEPFGLNLFSALIKNIEEIKIYIGNNISQIKQQIPKIDTNSFLDNTKNIFNSMNINEKEKEYIYECFNFNDTDKIEEIEKELISLKSNNYKTEIKLKMEKNNKSNIILEYIKNNCKLLVDTHSELVKIINELKETEVKVQEYQAKIDVLKQIPQINSTEWKEFISSADKYKKLVDDNDKCIYCGNPLNQSSINLINAYTEYLNNNIVQQRENIEKKFDIISAKLPNEFKIEIDSIIEDDYKKMQIDLLINRIINGMNNKLSILKEIIKNKNYSNSSISFDNNDLIRVINEYVKNNSNDINTLDSTDNEKELRIKELENELNNIKEKQSLFNQKDSITKWINDIEKIADLENLKNNINTSAISTLSKKAHKEILTEKLKTNFEEELSKLGFSNLKVELVESGASKGIVSTKLVLNSNNKITDVLSEGEQKAVSLAMFLAEINIRNDKNPIILDDPVNSLHHKIIKRFVERLLELENQIIIFTHNILFLSYFQTSSNAHECKNMKNGCSKNKGKHIYTYDVKEQDGIVKGLILPKVADNYESHIELAKKTLDERTPDYERTASSQIRYAIECSIDEKILLNIEPQKYSDKSSRINWDSLEKLGDNKKLLKSLRNGYERLSGGKTHRGLEQLENPLQESELRDIIEDIEKNMQ